MGSLRGSVSRVLLRLFNIIDSSHKYIQDTLLLVEGKLIKACTETRPASPPVFARFQDKVGLPNQVYIYACVASSFFSPAGSLK